jgi:hypothetical protein
MWMMVPTWGDGEQVAEQGQQDSGEFKHRPQHLHLYPSTTDRRIYGNSNRNRNDESGAGG